MKHKRLLLAIKLVLSFIVITLLHPVGIQAHNGMPILRVNNKFAMNNLQYNAFTVLPMAQDVLHEKFVVKQPVEFALEQKSMMISSELLNEITFKWTMDKESSPSTGLKVTHTFDKPGSYIVQLENRLPDTTTYAPLDSVQVDVVPTSSYAVPTVKIKSNKHSITKGESVKLVALVTVDKTASIKSYQWDFGQEETGKRDHPTESYYLNDISLDKTIYLRITDSNNLISDTQFRIVAADGKITFSPEDTIPSSTQTTKFQYVILPIALLAVIIAMILIGRSKNKLS